MPTMPSRLRTSTAHSSVHAEPGSHGSRRAGSTAIRVLDRLGPGAAQLARLRGIGLQIPGGRIENEFKNPPPDGRRHLAPAAAKLDHKGDGDPRILARCKAGEPRV